MALPLLLYAFGKATESKRNREKAAAITTFGQVGGKGPIIAVGPGEDAPDGFQALVAQTGLGQTFNVPQPKQSSRVAPIFAENAESLPGSPRGAETGFKTLPEWQASWANLPVPEFSARNAALIRVGTLGENGELNINEKLFPKYEEPSDATTSPVQIGAKRYGFLLNNDFIRADQEGIDKALKAIEKAETEDTPYSLTAGYQTTQQQEVSGTRSNFFEFTPSGAIPDLLSAAMAADIDSTLPYRHVVDGKEKVLFTPSDKSKDFYNRDIKSFVAANASTEFDYSTLAPGQIDRLHSDMFEYIRDENAMTITNGVIAYDPNKLTTQLTYSYQDEMKVPGFQAYFTSRVNQVDEEMVKKANAESGINSSTSATYTDSLPTNPGVKITVPTDLKNAEHTHEPYRNLMGWATNAFSNSKNPTSIAAAKIGNAINRYPNPADPSLPLEVSLNQYSLVKLDNFTRQTVNGVDSLTNAKNYFDPAQMNPTINDEQLRAVGIAMNGIPVTDERYPNRVLYTRKMSFVNAFAPDLESVGSIQNTYNRSTNLKQRFGGKPHQDAVRQAAAESRSTMEAVRLINESAALLFEIDNNGRLLGYTPFGQQVGETYVSLSGLYANAKAAVGVGLEALGIDENNTIVTGIRGALDTAGKAADAFERGDPNAGNIVNQQFGGYTPVTRSLSEEQLREEAGRRGMTVDEFTKAEGVARSENIAAIKQIVTDMSSPNTRKANIARRQYLNYVIAYTVAAALQGGTGGRTISDQDVQNVLNFLNPGNFSEPEVEYNNLMNLAADLTYRGQRAAAIASPNLSVQHNAMIVEELDARAGGAPIEKLIYSRIETGDTRPSGVNPPLGATGDVSSEDRSAETLKILTENLLDQGKAKASELQGLTLDEVVKKFGITDAFLEKSVYPTVDHNLRNR